MSFRFHGELPKLSASSCPDRGRGQSFEARPAKWRDGANRARCRDFLRRLTRQRRSVTVEFLNEDRSRVLRRARHLGNSSLLQQNYDAQIVAFCADIGQEEELEGLGEKARHNGETKCII